jgi:hypothetical protein
VIDEEMTARLLRLGGMRPDVPLERESRVRDAFLDEVRATSRACVVRRRMAMGAAVISLAAAAVISTRLWVTGEVARPVVEVVATVERLEGDVRIALGDPLRLGDRLDSGATGRIGVRLANGASLRFDHRSRVRFVSQRRIALDAGAVYVDSGSGTPALEIVTSFGMVKDIGTQFETRVGDSSLRVRVRSGVVEVHRGADVSSARAGTELTVTPALVTSQSVATYGQDWKWAASVGPAFETEGKSLSTFLEHVCREQGWTLVYADARLAREASGIMLRGSTQRLPPSDVLEVVMATTGLAHRVEDGVLEVARALQ